MGFASFVARPLAALRTEAVALRNRDFRDRIATPSIITEIHEFAATFASMREHIRKHNMAATRFIPEEFLRLLDRQDILSLELGDHVLRAMTILFSDIRSFTALSESMSPQQTFNFVNSYLTRVGPIIRDHHGFIDKYIGDAILGLFPQQPRDAIDAAIAMQRRVVIYNEGRARAGYAPIAIGIGLHRGDLMLGTIGESLRFETTVIADAVNIAARMESLTKAFGALILASGEVMEQVDAATYLTRRLGDVQVVGTTRPVTVDRDLRDADRSRGAPRAARRRRPSRARAHRLRRGRLPRRAPGLRDDRGRRPRRQGRGVLPRPVRLRWRSSTSKRGTASKRWSPSRGAGREAPTSAESNYRTLGKTGLKISEIGFGCGTGAALMISGDPAEQKKKAVGAGARAGRHLL